MRVQPACRRRYGAGARIEWLAFLDLYFESHIVVPSGTWRNEPYCVTRAGLAAELDARRALTRLAESPTGCPCSAMLSSVTK
jgi:hypothetical protein